LETELVKAIYVTSSLDLEKGGDLRGHIDEFDLRKGIRGWAINLTQPSESATVEIILGSDVVAQCKTDIPRKDISDYVQTETRAGFRFSHDAIQALWERLPAGRDEPVAIRFSGTSLLLPSPVPLPTLGKAFFLEDQSRSLSTTYESRLADLYAQGRELAAKPLRPFPYHQAGYIEAIAFEEPGWIWASGWMRRPKTFDGAAVIIDNDKKWPAAAAFTLYEREDMKADACAFIAVIHTDWVPDPNSSMSLLLSDDLSSRISCIAIPQVRSVDEFFQYFAGMKDRLFAGRTQEIHQLIHEWQAWRPTRNSSAQRPTIEAAIEQSLILPGFGCLVTGWAISLLKPIVGFSLKLGSTIMPCDPRSLYFKSRADLASIFPGHDKALSKAGFTAVFRGDVATDNVLNPVLKIRFTDGTSHNIALDLRNLRQLGTTTHVDAACELYPSLRSEIFFPEFAAAVRAQSALARHAMQPYFVQPASKVIVLVAPEDKGEHFLLFEELQQFARNLPAPVGIVVIAADSAQRGLTSMMFEDFRKDSSTPASLFFTDDTTTAFYALPQILSDLEATSFAFVGANIFLTPEGWNTVCGYLGSGSDSLHFFEVLDPAMPEEDAGCNSALCFGWTHDALRLHLETAPHHVGPFIDAKPLPVDQASERSLGCAWFSRLPIPTPLALAINSLVEEA